MDVLTRFLDAYGEYMEFCQIQLNYLDWNFQDARAKVELLNARHIPVWVMEPVRGGRLANLPEHAVRQLKELRPDESVPAWAFRFLQSVPGVTMILSGMSSLQQVQDNVATFAEDRPLNRQEFDAIVSIADNMGSWISPGCWRCTTSTPLPAAGSWRPWRWKPCPTTKSPRPASAAAAARLSARSRSRSRKPWPISPISWG